MKVMNARLVRLARRVDFIWKPLSFLSGRRPPRTNAPVRSILVIDLHLVGDMVMLSPLLAAMRKRYPTASLSLLAGPWAREVLAGMHLVDAFIPFAAPWVKPQGMLDAALSCLRIIRLLRRSAWDVGIEVRGDIRQILLLWIVGAKRRVGFDFTGGASLLTDVVPDDGTLQHVLDHHERIAKALDAWSGEAFVPVLPLSPSERNAAVKISRFVGFHFGASLPLRRLPRQEAVALLNMYAATDDRLVIFSPPDLDEYVRELLPLLPRSLVERIDLWRGSLRDFIVMASRATQLFVMDSGPAHIAAALGCRTIAFYGPNLPAYTAPRGRHVEIVERPGLACRPCDQRHCTNAITQACMLGLAKTFRADVDR